MIEASSAALKDMGVADDKIRYELFTPSGAPPVASARAAERPRDGVEVEVVLDGARRAFRLTGDDEIAPDQSFGPAAGDPDGVQFLWRIADS